MDGNMEMHENVEPASEGLPLSTGTIGDTISKAFAGAFGQLKTNIIFFSILAAVCAAVAVVLALALKQFNLYEMFIREMDNSFHQVYGELFGSLLLNNYIRTIPYAVGYLVIIVPLSYKVYSFVKSHQAFAGLQKRGFVSWLLWWYPVNVIVYMLLCMLVIVAIGAIVVLVDTLLFVSGNIFAIILGVIVAVLAAAALFASTLAYYAVLNQVPIFSMIRRMYPIRTLSCALRSACSESGTRSGGILGGNLWHCILFSLILWLIMYAISMFSESLFFGLDFLIPKTIEGASLVVIAMYSFIRTYVLAFTVYLMTIAHVLFISENMVFGVYPLRQELENRAGK